MLRKTLIVSALAAFAVAGSAFAQNPPVAEYAVKRTVVAKIDVPGTNYEVITAMLEIAPGFKAGRHFHPGLVTGHILEGQFWLALDGQPEKTLGRARASIADEGDPQRRRGRRQADEGGRHCGGEGPAAGAAGEIKSGAPQNVALLAWRRARLVAQAVGEAASLAAAGLLVGEATSTALGTDRSAGSTPRASSGTRSGTRRTRCPTPGYVVRPSAASAS